LNESMQDNSGEQIFVKIRQFSKLDGQRVLEIGCGDGRISEFLVHHTDKLVGIDPDEEKIKKARDNIPKGKFRVGSGENLEFSNGYFDFVIFALSLHHQDSRKSLREAARVLKDEGSILVIEPLCEGEVERVFAIVHNEDRAKMDAQQAIEESDLSVELSEVFQAHWVFNSKEDVSETIFDYYDMPFDSPLAGEIYEFLGDKAQGAPLELLDEMIIQVLSKKASPGRAQQPSSLKDSRKPA
jgi:ubiquinone/menaquinone biosynthesis C-methylase UbiE